MKVCLCASYSSFFTLHSSLGASPFLILHFKSFLILSSNVPRSYSGPSSPLRAFPIPTPSLPRSYNEHVSFPLRAPLVPTSSMSRSHFEHPSFLLRACLVPTSSTPRSYFKHVSFLQRACLDPTTSTSRSHFEHPSFLSLGSVNGREGLMQTPFTLN